MSTLVTKAFVMNSFPWKDRHRLLHLLTPEHGLITAMAPAAESLKSKLRAVSQLFSYSELTLSEQNGRYNVKDGALIEAFTALSQDLDRLAAAAHAVEVFSDVARNDEPNRQVFELWAYTVYEISRSEDPVFIARMSSMRLMEIIGLSLDLDACISCREPIEGAYFFSYLAGGLLCEKDRAKGQRDAMTVLSKGTVALLLHIERAPFEKLYRFQASDKIRREASCLADRWVEEKMEKRYKRLSLLDSCLDFSFNTKESEKAGE